MDVALASLDRGVRALFTEPTAILAASSSHPLCECIIYQAPPPDWRYLARFPVLKRHVLAEFRSAARETSKTPQTPRKRKKRGIGDQYGGVVEYKALAFASLCQKLAQCKLLAVREAELMRAVVNLESLDVLAQVIGGKLLPLRLRILLLSFALQEQGTKCLEVAVQQWIQEICEKILEEILEPTSTGRTNRPPAKRARTRSNDIKTEETEKKCEFCHNGTSAEYLRSKGGWEFLVKCTQQAAKILEQNGENYVTNKAMAALSAFWDSLPMAGVTTVKKGRRKSKELVESDEIVSLLNIEAYERIYDLAMENMRGEPQDPVVKMWMSVWERELKNYGNAKHIQVVDVIRHCVKADAFAAVVLPLEKKGDIANLPGYRVLLEVVRSLSIGIFGVITALGQVWSGIDYEALFSHITIHNGAGTMTTKRILRLYSGKLLKTSGGVRQSSADNFLWSSRTAPLDILLVLYEIFSASEVNAPFEDSFFMYWDAFMTEQGDSALLKECGIHWCQFLEICLQSLDTNASIATRRNPQFLPAFKSYCLAVMHRVILSGGEVISSGGSIQHQLIRVETDRSTVRGVLTKMMVKFGEGWTASLIAAMLRVGISLSSTGKVHQRGVKFLLFPALVSCLKSTRDGHKTGRQQFTALVSDTNRILMGSEPTPLYLVSLIRFSEAWDAYQSTHTKDSPTRVNRWGFCAMIELDILPQLLSCYERDEVVCQESSEALMFAAEVLQNSPNCPQSLERSLFKVLSDVKAGAERAKSPGDADEQLLTPSSDILQRFLRAVKFADQAQTRQLIRQIKDQIGALDELRQQLERWFSFVEMHGTAFAGKESRLELSVLGARLIRWFPSEFESMRFLLMTPLDSHLVFALKAFVKEAGRPHRSERQSFVNSAARSALPSAVRVEMALHLYVSAAAFPDLETLTVLLTKAMVKCRFSEAFNHLAKVARKNSRMLLPEVAVATLSSPLRGLEFSSSALVQQDENDEQLQIHTRHAKAIIYQENALKLLSTSTSMFERGISWSMALFGEQSAVTWLPHFFEAILKTGFCEGSLRVELLLTSLEEMVQTREKVFQEAYWLAALLNTALVACSSRCAGAYADVDVAIRDRMRIVVGNMLRLLSMHPDTQKAEREGDQAGNEIIRLANWLKSSRLSIDEDGAYWIREHLIGEKTASVLRLIVSNSWNSDTHEAGARVEEPLTQLFLPFVQWLSAALVYSQSFLEEASPTMRRWERTFTSYVTDLYLHLEFEADTCSLLKAWLTTWITSNITRGQEELQLLALLPSQVALFRRLGLTPDRSLSAEHSQPSTIYQLIFVAINLAGDQYTAENPAGIEQATELVVSTLTTLELVELSASSDFVRFSKVQDLDLFFSELEIFLSRPQLRACSVDQVCCLLQYPLEILVCCYACKIPAHLETESQGLLQRIKQELQKNLRAISYDNEATSFTMDPTAVDAFFQYWADEMLLKYDYIDRARCSNVLQVIQAAVQSTDQ
ncbi:hypothetical protein P3T76_009379 [Phytophthora citrophthora]|uniref:Uncharacterized protein n=1 Tax=Phytophthora citrophthora TaxID=4793 RepID=A0AAD9LK09_9STRA|nr:hypothetical protein P3T76_009379 [Phytophthora citrophthora]